MSVNRATVGTKRPLLVLVAAIALTAVIVAASTFFVVRPPQNTPSPMSVAVVGDSYSAGLHNRVVWPTLLAQRTGWPVANFALPGAGYARDDLGGYAFAYQVERAVQSQSQIVLIVGGMFDVGLADTGAVTDGAAAAINKAKLAGQRVLVIGPTWYQVPAPAGLTTVADLIHRVADDARVPYLSALDPPWLTKAQMQPDLSGPTDDGQSVIADKIAAWLRSEVAE